MNPTEAVQLCRLVKACCPSQVFDEWTPAVWADVLASYSYDDAKAVVLKLVATPVEFGRSGYIEPRHIIGGIHKIRASRLTDTALPNPPSDLDGASYIDWTRQQRALIAAGQQPTNEPITPADPERIQELIRANRPGQITNQPAGDGVDLDAERNLQQDALQSRITNDQVAADGE